MKSLVSCQVLHEVCNRGYPLELAEPLSVSLSKVAGAAIRYEVDVFIRAVRIPLCESASGDGVGVTEDIFHIAIDSEQFLPF